MDTKQTGLNTNNLLKERERVNNHDCFIENLCNATFILSTVAELYLGTDSTVCPPGNLSILTASKLASHGKVLLPVAPR